jgi:anti-anti-sigma regulatory factor
MDDRFSLHPFTPRHLVSVPTGTPNVPTEMTTSHARITVALIDDEAHIDVVGEIDLANVGSLRSAIRDARSMRPRRIVIDASDLDFLAVGAARELFAARDVTIVNAYGISKRVLDLIASETPAGRMSS